MVFTDKGLTGWVLRMVFGTSVRTVAAAPSLLFSGALLAALLGVAAGGCAPRVTSEVTGRSIPVILSWEEEVELGKQTAEGLVEQHGGLIPDTGQQAYVAAIGERLVPHLEEGVPELPWSFELLDSGVINAFSLPGGRVFVSAGLAALLESEAELAGVIGHEMAHVTLRHTNQRLAKLFERNAPVLVPAAILSVLVPKEAIRPVVGAVVPVIEIGGSQLSLRFGREQELEADAIGARYIARAGYPPAAQRVVLQRLGAGEGAGRSRPPAFLSTHPAPEARVRAMDRLLETDFSEWAPRSGSGDGGWGFDRYRPFRRRVLESVLDEALVDEPVARFGWCAHCVALAGRSAGPSAGPSAGNTRSQLPR
ncbi:MAG: M48 family metallopeptidase [Planctomycetota bacterium]